MKRVPSKTKNKITGSLLTWYKNCKRDLPWRKTHKPYKILVSEVMLQQTQVSRVLVKYREFLTAFPTIEDLATASPAEVIKAWKGLGYNRRALFLQKTAQTIVNEYSGKFPNDIKSLCALPGIGDYTARAILSFAFKKPIPMMDTNHRRFYGRVFCGVETPNDKELLQLAEKILPKKDAYDFNQALMDFGSSICTSKKPRCADCPIRPMCKAYPDILNTSKQIKTPKKNTTPFKQTNRYIRGRIIDKLRTKQEIPMEEIVKNFPEFTKKRIVSVIEGLQKDHLIIKQNGRILLPKD